MLLILEMNIECHICRLLHTSHSQYVGVYVHVLLTSLGPTPLLFDRAICTFLSVPNFDFVQSQQSKHWCTTIALLKLILNTGVDSLIFLQTYIYYSQFFIQQILIQLYISIGLLHEHKLRNRVIMQRLLPRVWKAKLVYIMNTKLIIVMYIYI